ncbi:putative quinol monooxygenase [Pedobacter sp.]|uniref:putative quinol monooxygenase n=1 Tax=Pedobacter sp. TaxID=1411316 RepID=UPI00396CF0FD
MLTRIVKMHFNQMYTTDFKRFFASLKSQIETFDGCKEVNLFQDKANPEIFFTISKWENEDSLENYRHSALFKETWAVVKPNFVQKAEVWSLSLL